MRCLFITGNYKPAVNSGGPVHSVSSLAGALVQKGHSVTVLALNEDDGVRMEVPLHEVTDVNGVTVIYFARSHALYDSIRRRFTQVARWESAFFEWCREHIVSFDWVHLHIGLLQPARWVSRFCEQEGIVLAYHQRGNLDSRRFKRLKWLKSLYVGWVERPVLERADVLFALSQREADVFREWTPNAREQLLPNGVDADFWLAPDESSLGEREQRRNTDKPRVVWSARWDLRKGPLEFIEMAQLVSNRLPKVEFLMIGPERGADFAKVEAAAAQSGLKNLRLLQGLDAASRREQLQAADCFVLPTYGEGFSLGILEALAAGCVVLTTDEANFPELSDQPFGHILKNKPQVFADALVEVLSGTPMLNYSVRRAASEFVRNHYDWSTIGDRYLEIMKTTLNG